MINNKVGVVNARPDAIQPLQQASLNLLFEQLSEDNMENTAAFSSSQGLNKDAVSKQNSSAMIKQL